MRRGALVIFFLLPFVAVSRSVNAQVPISFDQSAPDRIVISNSLYSLALSKTNGAILDLVDRSTGVHLTHGSSGGCLWGSVFYPEAGSNFVGGCSYNPGTGFSYRWDGTATLTLTYTPASGQNVGAVVTIVASPDAWFDMRITVQNSRPDTVEDILFPGNLLFGVADVRAGYAPYYLPGVRLDPAFFASDLGNVPTYPGQAAFADYLGLDLSGSHLAIYRVQGPNDPVVPVDLGFVHGVNSSCPGENFCTYHSFHTWVRTGGSWTSPTVRFLVNRSVDQSMLAYRNDNGISAYPSAAAKAGARFPTLARTVLLDADAVRINEPFRSWITDLDQLPGPVLLHPVALEPGGFDTNYPDILPPAPAWGSTDDLRAVFDAVRARGGLVMPYTNPTWWDQQSPTVQGLGANASSVAVQSRAGPVLESYNGHTGLVISPNVPFVQNRLAQAMDQWRTTVPADCIFEDQIGSRSEREDLNPTEPDPMGYHTGWLAHTVTYMDRCLMTENGWDRLAATEVGFHGGLLGWEALPHTFPSVLDVGHWRPYPLALWLFHDKVLFYQHNLITETMLPGLTTDPAQMLAANKTILTWNMAFGTMLTYLWIPPPNDSLTSPWLDLAMALQRDVAARFAGQPMTDYAEPAAGISETSFGSLHIMANWQTDQTYDVGSNRLAPRGFLATTDDGAVTAGIFRDRFNGVDLSAGDHFLVMERTPDSTQVYQPIGADSEYLVPLPQNQPAGGALRITAFTRSGTALGDVAGSVSGGQVQFAYQSQLAGQAVAYYRIAFATSPTSTPTMTSTPTSGPISAMACRASAYHTVAPALRIAACVSASRPHWHSRVVVRGQVLQSGQGVAGVAARATFHFPGKTGTCAARTDTDGVVQCAQRLGTPPIGRVVRVIVKFTVGGRSFQTTTRFTPRR